MLPTLVYWTGRRGRKEGSSHALKRATYNIFNVSDYPASTSQGFNTHNEGFPREIPNGEGRGPWTNCSWKDLTAVHSVN